jgi:hypothetical protein
MHYNWLLSMFSAQAVIMDIGWNESTISTRTRNTEFELLDNAVGKLLSVPKEVLKEEARLKRQREKKWAAKKPA